MNRTHLVFVLLSSSILNPQSFLAAQVLDPPYLREIPSVERVLKEIQGKDADETAAKHMGTFLQFKSLIETMSGRRRYQNKLTPDENRLISEYHTAYFQVTQRKPEYTKMPALKGFDIDPRWRSELFTRYFSAEFTAQYAAVDAMFERRHKEFLQGEIEQHKRAQAEKAEYERKMSGNDASTAKMRKCIEAGRDETKCAMEALGGGLSDMIGTVAPGLVPKAVPGLKVNGEYPGRSFGLSFAKVLSDYNATVSCAGVVDDPYPTPWRCSPIGCSSGSRLPPIRS